MSFELLHAKVNEWKLTAVCIVDPDDDDDFLGKLMITMNSHRMIGIEDFVIEALSVLL